MLKSGLVSATFKLKCPVEVISLASKAGLKGIEWSEGHHIPLSNADYASEIARLTRDEGIEVAEYGSYFRLSENMDIRPSLDNAKAMDAPIMRIWAGNKGSRLYSERERDSLIEEANRVLDEAEKYSVKLAFEWHKNTLTDSNESAISLLESLSGRARTLWQPNYLLSFSEMQEGLLGIESYLESLHVFWWEDSKRMLLSDGESEWRTLFESVKGDHWALLEFVRDDSEENFLSDSKTLKRLIGEV